MKTLRKQISKNGEVKSIFLQEDSPASHSVLQGRERERKITATSGVKCYEQYGKFSPLGLLAKTLMESSQWYSLARRLRWGVRTIYSKRITYTEKSSNSQLMPSVKTLKVQDIPSSRLLFQLVPSEHPTEEIGCGLLRDLMPTPIAGDAQGGAAKLTKGKRLRNGKVYSATLKDLVAGNMLPTPQTQGLKVCNKDGKTEFLSPLLLPTPTAIDKGTGRINKSLSKNVKERPTLAKCAKMQLLPTPNASEGTKWTTKYNVNSQMGKGLTAMACSGLLLTPMGKDGMRSCMTMNALKKHGKPKANLAEQIAHKIGGGTSQLNPLYVTEMMGYPLEWLTLPFLSQNGEVKASKR